MKLGTNGEPHPYRVRAFIVAVSAFYIAVGYTTLNYAPSFITTPVVLAFVFLVGGTCGVLRAVIPHSIPLAVIAGAGMIGGSFMRAFAIALTIDFDTPFRAFLLDPSVPNQDVSRVIAIGQWTLMAVWLWVSWAPMLARADGDPDWWKRT
jgi:hypothetical protein